MTIRHAHYPVARAFIGAMLAASITTGSGFASAKTCTPTFPSLPFICQQGTTVAKVVHVLGFEIGGAIEYKMSVDFQGGSNVATAYGIDVNGTHLNTCATTAADDDSRVNKQSSVSCANLYGTPGTAQPNIGYTHPFDMASTFIIVI